MLGCYLEEADTISEITDKVYPIGKATEIKMRKLKKQANERLKRKPYNGIRRERKLQGKKTSLDE